MICERDVEWTCHACLDFSNCLLCHLRDDKPCDHFHPDQRYIDNELRRLNAIESEKRELERAKELGAKKCPFCGGRPLMLVGGALDVGYNYCVSCEDIDCRGHKFPHGDDPDNEEDAVKRWNRRDK